MVTRSEAVQRFLAAKTHTDLSSLYNIGMECQVNVGQDGGERINGEFKGRKWHGWTDGTQTWKSFRIPFHANTVPEYNDSEIKFDLTVHAEGIGLTGWDWKHLLSRWVAFDFDAITGHSNKHSHALKETELAQVKEAACSIPWVTVRRSTGGSGLHLYVFLDPVPTVNHNEHAALARSVLGMMAAYTGFDFSSKVDICGGNMWVWHRKMAGTNGLQMIKQGDILYDVPANWRDHVKVVSGKRRKTMPSFIADQQKIDDNESTTFDELTGQLDRIPLDNEHKRLIEYLRERGAMWWWDQDHHMLVTHTFHLKEAHEDLQLKGIFDTNSVGTEKGADYNCYSFPLRRGAWTVRRFTPGVQEHPTWEQDGAGWTRCFLNREPDLKTAAQAYEGIEDTKGNFVFRHAELALKAAQLLGVAISIPSWALGRRAIIRKHKDGRLIIEFDRDSNDSAGDLRGWLPEKKQWQRLFNATNTAPNEPESGNYDDLVRHIVSETGQDAGWVIYSDSQWREEPLNHVKDALAALGHVAKDIRTIVGSSIFKCWTLVNRPFQPEYLGDRQWNRKAAQIRFAPSQNEELHYPHWQKILQHCGASLDEAIKINGWARANGVANGADYLKIWIASLFQNPMEPLPYLFFYSPEQNTGKSIIHEALQKLFTTGYQRADAALINQSGFNAELRNAVLCVVEETDLRKDRRAYNRIKDWVTAPMLPVHEKNMTPYLVPNSTHWIQTANDQNACPVFTGDTRITMSYVGPLDPIDQIPKRRMMIQLEKEAPDFIAEILRLEIPDSGDRLAVPVIETEDKRMTQKYNQTLLEMFIDEKCYAVSGSIMQISEFYERFQEWAPPEQISNWTKIRVGREMPPKYPKGRRRSDGQFCYGNISWKPFDGGQPKPKIVLRGEYLEVAEG